MRKSIQVIMGVMVLLAITACSGNEKPAVSESKSTFVEESSDNNVLFIKATDEYTHQTETLTPDAQALKISIKDGMLYLDQEVLTVQSGVGSNANGEPTPAYLVKVIPGILRTYHYSKSDGELRSSQFIFSYFNEEHTIEASLSLFNHYETLDDFVAADNIYGEQVFTSDEISLRIDNTTSDGVSKAKLFQPGFGVINVNFNYEEGIEKLQTGDDALTFLRPYLPEFISRFEVISEWKEDDTLPSYYVQFDSEYFSYNVDNDEKSGLDFRISMYPDKSKYSSRLFVTFCGDEELALSVALDNDNFDGQTIIDDEYVYNIELYEEYGKGLLVPLRPEGEGKYGYDKRNLILLTDKAAIKVDHGFLDKSGLTKDEIRDSLNFIFDNGALKLK